MMHADVAAGSQFTQSLIQHARNGVVCSSVGAAILSAHRHISKGNRSDALGKREEAARGRKKLDASSHTFTFPQC